MTNYDYLYNKEYYGGELTADHRAEKEMGWRVFPSGTVLPYAHVNGEICGGLLDEQGRYIDGSGLHRGMGHGYGYSPEETSDCDEDVVLLGIWPGVWGHCLTDNISRLWLLRDEDFMKRYGKMRFLYIPMDNNPLGRNFREILSRASGRSSR